VNLLFLAAMHDFCLTLPYGGLLLVGGLVGGVVAQSIMSLITGELFGAAGSLFFG